MPKLLFIDTNIYLDFYRIRNEVRASFLEHLEAIKDCIITTDQVEMEFKKNRQHAILEGMKELSPPAKIEVPGILQADKSAKAISKDHANIKKRIKKLRTRMDKVLENPSRSDKAYQAFQRIFKKKQEIDLHRGHKKRYDVRDLAKKRFMLGYPPRKRGDTSIGDSINWEWLILVAKQGNYDIWIVSRDGDFGTTQNDKGYLNDWLRQEFQERINKVQKLTLCPKLSIALKEFEIPITPEEEQEEERVIKLSGHSSLKMSDSVEVTVHRTCHSCGKKFEPNENERICPICELLQ